jgi:hypothetical protein
VLEVDISLYARAMQALLKSIRFDSTRGNRTAFRRIWLPGDFAIDVESH